jgi:plasmid stabilization system protein ParE
MNEKKFRFAEPAQVAYEAAINYVLEQNGFAAERFVEDVDAAIERVCRFPESGSVIREYLKGPFRQFIVKRYRFIYRLDGDVVLIVAVWHGAQNATRPMDV